ncbi:hypothetical protein Pcinc_018038 [Petrolisthes cinctipes]|uniref:Protein kinase domain-containing protein n=1 Tax=Petrolisthes cinctipes TaxID=88211 RepID=A0AAE1KM35_PETCI|nr:hypothetical protein Pcinc_018038 [Petrolisthes cinctipes]
MSSSSRQEHEFKELPPGLKVVTEFGTFTVSNGLAVGRCCEVYEGYLEGNSTKGDAVAVKVFRRHQEYRGALQREVHILHTLAKPGTHLVQHIGETVWEGRDILVQELLGPTLRQVLISHHNSTASPWLTLTLATHVLRGLHNLHSSGCVHADLKPPNVLWDPNIAGFKLVDFGLAYSTSEHLSHAIQSRGYQAPESMKWNECKRESGESWSVSHQPGPSADIWSAGCIIAECLTGTRVSSEGDVAATVRSLLASAASRYPLSFLVQAWTFIARCVAKCPEDRPSADTLLSDPWLITENFQPTFHDLLLLPTPVVRLLNVTDPTTHHSCHIEGVEVAVVEVCKKYGTITNHHLEALTGKLYVEYEMWTHAEVAQAELNGTVFRDRTLVASFFPLSSWQEHKFF